MPPESVGMSSARLDRIGTDPESLFHHGVAVSVAVWEPRDPVELLKGFAAQEKVGHASRGSGVAVLGVGAVDLTGFAHGTTKLFQLIQCRGRDKSVGSEA